MGYKDIGVYIARRRWKSKRCANRYNISDSKDTPETQKIQNERHVSSSDSIQSDRAVAVIRERYSVNILRRCAYYARTIQQLTTNSIS